LRAKNFTNYVDASAETIMRAAKHVVNIGRKALAVATGAKSGYKDGTLPSGKTIADYHPFVCERMYVMLNGTSGGATVAKAGSGNVDDPIDVLAGGSDDEGGVGDGEGGNGHGKEDEIDADRTSAKALDPADMSEDYMFDGMIAFFFGDILLSTMTQEQVKAISQSSYRLATVMLRRRVLANGVKTVVDR
jgi:hypothetical protein